MKVAIINGPNLNLLGRRAPQHYGTLSMEQVVTAIQRRRPDLYLYYYQSNHEGDLIDQLQATIREEDSASAPMLDGIILNAGGYSHTSVALRDAVELCTVPVVEVHISDIYAREPFRRKSLLTDVCAHSIIGHGTDGYQEAIEWIEQHLTDKCN